MPVTAVRFGHGGRDQVRTLSAPRTIDLLASSSGVLQALGYRLELSFEKRRETWKTSGCTVELDELPILGSCPAGAQAVELLPSDLFTDNPLAMQFPIVHADNPAYSGSLTDLRLNILMVRTSDAATSRSGSATRFASRS